jgi:hypothetical protein
MSVYATNKFCHRVSRDPQLRALAQENPAAALSGFDLTEAERKAIATGDVGWLIQHGTHPVLLVRLCVCKIGGLTDTIYSERVRAVAAAPAADPDRPGLPTVKEEL